MMKHLEKKRQLETIAKQKILSLIISDYVLYGLPYYNNVGDILIWNGELEFLKCVPHKCVGTCAWNKYPRQKKLSSDITILITGGGYFGDVWRQAWQEVLDGIQGYEDNKIVIMPCSIYYNNEATIAADSEYLSRFKNLIICARDQQSFDIARSHFQNKVLLVPDMAFCMNEKPIIDWSKKKASKSALYLKRSDKELVECNLTIHENDLEIHDWTPMEGASSREHRFYRHCGMVNKLFCGYQPLTSKVIDYLYRVDFRRAMTLDGLEQLSQYERIYTTRLHAMILGMMLGRDVQFINNNNGKIAAFYDTWLSDCDNVTPYC